MLRDFIAIDFETANQEPSSVCSVGVVMVRDGQIVDSFYETRYQVPVSHVRPDAPPVIIISGDRELELYGRYEEQAYFWRMLKLVGHKDVTIYEMQGYDHGAMPQPAYKILKDHIRRLTNK